MSLLKIYKASAGSGKTYTLTGEYLRLLLDDTENYRRILAVTFTNKAAEEMKDRILKQLNKLARGKKSDYRKGFMREIGIDAKTVNRRAQTALSKILHNYSDFHISTIDSFFQNIIRSFIREVGRDASCDIELDNDKVLGEITDRLLLDMEQDQQLRTWLISFTEEQVESGRSWDVKRPIRNLGSEIFKETFKLLPHEVIEQLQNRDNLKAYQKQMFAKRAGFENMLSSMGVEWIMKMEQACLAVESFPHGASGLAGYPQKLAARKYEAPGKRVQNAIDDDAVWLARNTPQDVKKCIEKARDAGLQALLKNIVDYYAAHGAVYETSKAILRHFGTLGILVDLSQKIQEYCAEHNVLLLSDAGALLSEIIGDSDAPFVYEKTGMRINHFMIDEFQDTSCIQWKDFLPLISNSLAQGHSNLVVGDVKQSIYRWRNSDWNILAREISRDLQAFQPQQITLEKNFRSGRAMVEFNNSLFTKAADILQKKINSGKDTKPDSDGPIVDAYRDIEQAPAVTGDAGYVQIDFFTAADSDSWEETATKRIPGLIEQLRQQGFRLKDIAILVREKKQGGDIARYLMDYGTGPDAKPGLKYDVVSDEAIYLKNSYAVQFITALLRHLVTPEDGITRAQLLHLYFQHLASEAGPSHEHALFNPDEGSSLFARHILTKLTDASGVIPCLSAGELAESIIHAFRLASNKDQLPYIQAFQDTVQEYLRTGAPDLQSFLDWWDEQGQAQSVPLCQDQDAIRILTIHKAKGLEFKAVIIPFCTWGLDHPPNHESIVWCRPAQQPFAELGCLPMSYHSLKKTIFTEEYYQEKMLSYVDSLNLLYVACTRACTRLYVLAPKDDRAPEKIYEKLSDVGSLLYLCIKSMEGLSAEKDVFRSGSENNNANTVKAESNYPCRLIRKKFELAAYPCRLIRKKLKQKYMSLDYFDAVSGKISRGRLLHELFSSIRTADDIGAALCRLQFEGKITGDEHNELKEKIRGLLADSRVAAWFCGDWDIRTEADILLAGGAVRRPDRVLIRDRQAVVIDYKFGASGSEKYNAQVRDYAGILQSMGFGPVEGYLWFVEINTIEKVV